MLEEGKHADAEPLLRECLALRRKAIPKSWLLFNAMSLLGASLAGQAKHKEAEALLVEGYEGMQPPKPLAHRKREALERVIQLYEAWGKKRLAIEWRKKLDEAPK